MANSFAKSVYSDLKDICKFVASDLESELGFLPLEEVERETAVMSEIQNGFTRNQLVAKVITTVIGVAASFTLTYYGLKWLTDAMDPTKKEKKLAQAEAQKMLNKLGVDNVGKLTDYELCVAANLLDTNTMTITWEHIGGLENTIQDIRETVILPFKRADLFRHSSLIQPPKGILLYGPPGCGKTMVAKATARAAGARFINLQVSTLVDKWYGESQKRAEAVFSLATKLQPTIIFIDEIDSFLRSRSSTDHEATAMMKTQFMSLWDGLTTDPSCRIMIMGATNRVQDVDAAILRRMPCQFYVGMPDQAQRESILQLILRDENVDDLNYEVLSRLAEGLSGSDLREVCRNAAVAVVHDFVRGNRNGQEGHGDELRQIQMDDLQNAIHKVRAAKRLSSQMGLSLD